ncbi:MAG: TIGR03960 family B12-binding radical SAM protein [Coriobacteriales bacterium]|nr:TIGR03960 family B12-binding radical SAM protein [Coriobacteriales bacterium]
MITIRDRINLWPRIEQLLDCIQKPSRYIDHEFGAVKKDEASFRCVLIYPDTYEVGLPNQGLAILYNILNQQEDIACERAYVPWIDMGDLMRERNVPLCSMESYFPVASFDMVGIQIPHELAATNILETLDLAGIPLFARDRAQEDAIVCGGGPSVYNPEPFAPFYDAIMIGDGEEVICEVAGCIKELREQGAPRAKILEALAAIDGVYVPLLYDEHTDALGRIYVTPKEGSPAKACITKRLIPHFADTDPLTSCLVPYVEVVHDRLSIEVLRGCARGCRFCQAGMTYRPVRERPSDQIVASVICGLQRTGYDEVSLTSLSSTDHSTLEKTLRRLNALLSGSATSVSLPSERLDSFGLEMAELVAGEKKSGLTFAPEAGTQRMRDVINKGITEDDLMNTVRAAFGAGWLRMKLYFMMGLPTETDEDVLGIADLCGRALELAKSCVPGPKKSAVKISTSVAVFIPKAQTPFQWCAQTEREEVLRRQKLLASAMPKGVTLHYHDHKASFLEAVLSRSGRELAPVIAEAHAKGARFDAWTECFDLNRWHEAAQACNVDIEARATVPFNTEDPLPWSHISCGVSTRFLKREWQKAQEGILTPDCTMHGCTGCGVCPTLKGQNVLEGVRRG